MKLLAYALRDLLFPPAANCVGCGSPLGCDDGWFCAECARMLRPLYGEKGYRCPRCGQPGPGGRRCRMCGPWPEGSVEFARWVYPYRRPVSRMARQLKYRGVSCLAEWMAQQMTNLYLTERFPGADAIVPVPMHPSRRRRRGFNQAQLLAQGLSARVGIPVCGCLVRTRDTPQQARLSGDRRRKNLEGAFLSGPEAEGKRLLIVDDVLTTGATVTECALALKRAGAVSVSALAFAGSAPGKPPRYTISDGTGGKRYVTGTRKRASGGPRAGGQDPTV